MSASARKMIVLYDILGNCHPDRVWSPNTLKVRYVLSYKKLPYRTHWVEYPDIAALCKELGAPPSGLGRNGLPLFSVPFIHDPTANRYVSNSIDIARHLDEAYPDTPRVFPAGSEALIKAYDDLFYEKGVQPMLPLAFRRVHDQLNAASQPYFRKTREGFMKMPLEELCTPANAPALWQALETALGRFDGYIGASGGPYVMGRTFSYADAAMAGWLTWIRRLHGAQSDEWRALETWHGGRWKTFMDAMAGLEDFAEERVSAQ